MDADELRQRTKTFGLRVIRLADSLPKSTGAQSIARQIVRSGTSVGANCRAACRARSPAEFRAKLGIVEEEADETAYWIELLIEAGYVKKELVEELLTEADCLTAIIVASIRTSRRRTSNGREKS